MCLEKITICICDVDSSFRVLYIFFMFTGFVIYVFLY
jgi:hypothetical protein